jgi:hypothetical protein
MSRETHQSPNLHAPNSDWNFPNYTIPLFQETKKVDALRRADGPGGIAAAVDGAVGIEENAADAEAMAVVDHFPVHSEVIYCLSFRCFSFKHAI